MRINPHPAGLFYLHQECHMTDETTQAVTPNTQAVEGQTEPEQTSGKQPLTHEAALAALEATRKEAADYRRKLRDIEGKMTEAEKAQAAEAERQAAEQGRFQELYETEKKARADIEEQMRQLQHDAMRKDAAQAAGIPQLWQRLQGSTLEELEQDAKALAEMMQPAQPANGQTARPATLPTPAPQGARGLTDEERRARATRTF